MLYVDWRNEEDMKELVGVPELGEEIRLIVENRLARKKEVDDSMRLKGGAENALKWSRYRVVEKRKETPRITSFIFEAVDIVEHPTKVEPGSHIRVKLGLEGKLVRAYSVVSGDRECFNLDIALESESRGGSKFMHEDVRIGDTLSFSEIKMDLSLSA